MSTVAKYAPIVVTGLAGILVGLVVPTGIDEMRTNITARFDEQTTVAQQLEAGVADIQARMGTVPDAATLTASIQEQLTASEGRIAAQAGAAPEAVTTGIEDIRARVETLTGEFAALREEMAAGAAAASATGPAVDEAGELASQIGAEGAVLLPGQGAIFGGSRIDLATIDVEAGTATMTPEGGEEASVAEGDTVQLTDTCSITLAGIASGAAYLAPEDCSEPAAEPAGAPAEDAAQPTEAEEAPAEDAAPAGAGQPEEDEAPDAAASPADGETSPDAGAPAGGPGEPAEEAEDEQPADAPAGATPAEGEEPGSDVPAEGAQAVPGQQPGQAEENAPNAGEPQGGQPQTPPAQ